MNSQNLANACAVILGAFLPYIWHNNPPTTGDQEKWAAATRLWQALRPRLETREGALDAAKLASGDASGQRMIDLAAVLAAMFGEDAAFSAEIEALVVGTPLAAVIYELGGVSEPRALTESAEKLRQQIMADIRAKPSMPRAALPTSIPACEVCGKQDASLRVVIYPYVMSALILTSRRAFAGVWCAQHAFMRQLWASIITATLGWWGLPFGLIFTPMTLWRLARGGDQPAEINQQMLVVLAQHHLRKTNNTREAIRCYQAALGFGESETIKTRLREHYAQDQTTLVRSASPVLIFSSVLVRSVLLGLGIGVLYYLIDGLTPVLFGDVGFIVSWLIFVMIVFLCGVLVVRWVEWGVRKTRLRDQDIAVVVAAMASTAALYMILTGSLFASFIIEGGLSEVLGTEVRAVWFFLWLFSRGGTDVIIDQLNSGELMGILYIGMLLVMAVIIISASVVAAQAAVRSQQALSTAEDDPQAAEPMPLSVGCLPVVALALVFMAAQAISLLLD